jgi:hypothetical protein
MKIATSSAASITALGALALSACADNPSEMTQMPQEAFWQALSSHCGTDGAGNAYAGQLVSEDERDADWQGRAMVAHWAECTPDRIAIAFHTEDPERPDPPSSSIAVGQKDNWDRSRTWLVTRTNGGLRLKHDHRHEDGSEDVLTQYGGDTAEEGTSGAQDFPVDEESIALFTREGLDASLTNVWRLEVDPAGTESGKFIYQLTRLNDPTRKFRVAFDTSTPIDPPPPAWGW